VSEQLEADERLVRYGLHHAELARVGHFRERLIDEADVLAPRRERLGVSGQAVTVLVVRGDGDVGVGVTGVDERQAGVPAVGQRHVGVDQVRGGRRQHGHHHDGLAVAGPKLQHAREAGAAGDGHPEVLGQRRRGEDGVHIRLPDIPRRQRRDAQLFHLGAGRAVGRQGDRVVRVAGVEQGEPRPPGLGAGHVSGVQRLLQRLPEAAGQRITAAGGHPHHRLAGGAFQEVVPAGTGASATGHRPPVNGVRVGPNRLRLPGRSGLCRRRQHQGQDDPNRVSMRVHVILLWRRMRCRG